MKNKLSKLHPAYILATWFYSGKAPKAPGTFGSLATIPFFFIFLYSNPTILSAAIICVVIFIVGVWSSNVYMASLGKHDPGEIVIDETIGQFMTLSYAFYLFGEFNLDSYSPILIIILTTLSFGLFRLFDIVKPFPIASFDKKLKGGIGVMFDDVLAAIYAIIVIHLCSPFITILTNIDK